LIFRVILIVGRNRGLTEEAARAQGLELKVGHFSYQANGKAIALCDSEGLIKTIFDA
jgi:dihydrolipoamide dehydrogenase